MRKEKRYSQASSFVKQVVNDLSLNPVLYGLFFIFFFLAPSLLFAQQAYTVNTIDDQNDGNCNTIHCSFREALEASNQDGFGSSILFDIQGTAPFLIQPQSPLPIISDELTIVDASSQTSWQAGALVLDGSHLLAGAHGLIVAAASCEIYGLQISAFRENGIYVQPEGIAYKIGGPGKGNVFNSNGAYAIYVNAAANGQIRANLIGSDSSGTMAVGNGGGIWLEALADATQIGGLLATEANLIVGMPMHHGLFVHSSHNQIIGNIIGTNWTLEKDWGNLSAVHLNGVGDNQISHNVMAYNQYGVQVLSGRQQYFSQNQLFCNRIKGIDLADFSNANNGLPAPEMIALVPDYVKGICTEQVERIEVYLQGAQTCNNTACQGDVFLGEATATNGQWLLNKSDFENDLILKEGDVLTAIAFDAELNSSEYANCRALCSTFSATAQNTGPYCYGEVIQLLGTFTGMANSISYHWEGPMGYQSDEAEPTDATYSGTYTFYVIADGCILPPVDTEVEIHNALTINEIAFENPVCEGATLVLDAPLINGAIYQWYDPSGALISTVDDAIVPGMLPAMAGQYQLVLSMNGCASEPFFVDVAVQAIPTMPEIFSNSPLCEGEDLIFESPLLTDASYRWFDPFGATISMMASVSIDAIQVSQAGNYSLELSIHGCVGPLANTIVTVDPQPVIQLIDDATCDSTNSFYTVELEMANGAMPYELTGGSGQLNDNHFISDPIVSGTPYAFEIFDANGCGPVVINGLTNCNCESQAGMMAMEAIQLCQGELAKASYEGGEVMDANDGLNFILHDQPGTNLGHVWAINTLPEFNLMPGMDLAKTYYIAAVVGTLNSADDFVFLDDPCLSVSAGTPVVFMPQPTQPMISGPAQACPGQSIRLIANDHAEPIMFYHWKTPQGGVMTEEAFLDLPNLSTSSAGTYQLWVETETCISDFSLVFDLMVDVPAGLADAGADIYVCGADQAMLQALPPESGISGEWISLSDALFTNPAAYDSEVQLFDEGTHLLIWQLSSPECPAYDSDTLLLWALANPTALADTLFLPKDHSFIEYDLWQNDEIEENTFYKMHLEAVLGNDQLTILEDGLIRYQHGFGFEELVQFEYILCQESSFCPDLCDTTLVNIYIELDPQDPGLFVPEGITPNGDGVNDALIIDGLERYPKNELIIFNRWGDVLFNARPYLNDWQGNYQGKPLPEGTYYYLLRSDLAAKRDLKGSISILR